MARLAADRICSGEILGTAFPSAYDPVMTPLEERAVLPFYLEMMGLNALHLSFGLWPELVTAAKAVTLDDAKWLLRVGAWRPVVMGAWFSVRFPAAEIGQGCAEQWPCHKVSYGTTPGRGLRCRVRYRCGAGDAAVR